MIYNKKHNKFISLNKNIVLQKINFNDSSTIKFLCELYKSTRYEEMKMSGLDINQINMFLENQFFLQNKDYTINYPNALLCIIIYKKKICGRLYVDFRETEIRLIDISLFPENRGQGIGTRIINILRSESSALCKPLTLNVEQHNRAKILYLNLGFKAVTSSGGYVLMSYEQNNGL